MNPQLDNVSMDAIRQALMRRSGNPGIGQGPMMPQLSQNTQTGAPTVMNPKSASPHFSSPFSGPKPDQQSQNNGMPPDIKQTSKSLIAKLLQML